MRWVIERNLFYANDQMAFVEALKARGSKMLLADFIPFAHEILPEPSQDEPLVAMGSTNFVRTVLKKGWKPGVWHNTDFRHEVWCERLGAQLLNFQAEVQPFGALVFHSPRQFLRPCEDLKVFPGAVVSVKHLVRWQTDTRQYDVMSEENILTNETPVVVAPVHEIEGEFRFFVVDRHAVSGCRVKPYWSGQSHPQLEMAWEFADHIAGQWGPADAYVLDVTKTPEGYFVGEYNCINAAGLYECPVEPIIESIENLVQSRQKL